MSVTVMTQYPSWQAYVAAATLVLLFFALLVWNIRDCHRRNGCCKDKLHLELHDPQDVERFERRVSARGFANSQAKAYATMTNMPVKKMTVMPGGVRHYDYTIHEQWVFCPQDGTKRRNKWIAITAYGYDAAAEVTKLLKAD